jgi:hypothetical protein
MRRTAAAQAPSEMREKYFALMRAVNEALPREDAHDIFERANTIRANRARDLL